MGKRTSRTRVLALRPLLVFNTVLFVCLTLLSYFLFDFSFFTGKETLTDFAQQNLIRQNCETAVEYLRAGMPNDPAKIDTSRIEALRTYFKPENTNFLFFFWQIDPSQGQNKSLVLGSRTIDQAGAVDDPSSHYVPAKFNTARFLSQIDPSIAEAFQNLSLDVYLRSPLTVHDDFYRAQQFVRLLELMKYPVLILFLLASVSEGFLWVRLCTRAAEGHISPALRELSDSPFYVLLMLFILATANILYVLRGQLQILYDFATFALQDDIRPALILSLLLLLLLSFLTTLLVSALCGRFAQPQWYAHSAFYRALSTPSIERRLQTWLSVAVVLEASIFLLLFLRFSIEDGRLFVLIDELFITVILLVASIQARTTSAYMKATRRIVLDGHGSVPTGDLRGKSLEHVQNINFLSQSAGEQMQLRFVNEAFGTKLIHNVSHSLRDPLTSVTAEVERLRSGELNADEARDSVARINDLSQELKKSIEDLLRIANTSAEGNEPQCTATDAGLMIEQTVGEFYDRFQEKQILLVRELPSDPLLISADGAYMWTVFDSILNEFLLYAVPGTRVFLQAQSAKEYVLLRIQGNVREDTLPTRRSLALPTAKIFTEKQGGTYRDSCEHDILTVELQFPRCTEE